MEVTKNEPISLRAKEIASTTARMFVHTDLIQYVKDTGRFKPVTIHLAPTDKCNLKCEWCSVKNRGSNELSIDECKEIVDIYEKFGLKSVEITGGGDPTMYNDLQELVQYIFDKGIALGMITNGLKLSNMDTDFTRMLTWLRISLSGVDVGLGNQYFDIDPDKLHTFLGCSYVFTDQTTHETISILGDIGEHLGTNYVRIVPNCYTPETIEWTRQNAPGYIDGDERFFLQIKDYSTPPVCYWRYVKPFVNSDGYVYQCSTCALFGGVFPEHWRVAHYKDVSDIYEGQPTSFNTDKCTLCFYSRQNLMLADMVVDVKHKEFL